MLELQAVKQSFGHKDVLKDISIRFPEGVVALLGPNGAGKTTLLRTILELYRCNSGEIQWDGEPVTNQGIVPSLSGYLPQKFGVSPNLTCRDMLRYFALLKNVPKAQVQAEIMRCLELVNLSDRADCLCRKLSGGMVRRLGIAQAMLGDPKLVLFDEPTTGLDPEERLRFKLMVHNAANERTILVSTHIVDDVEALCNHVVIMDQGRIVASLPSRQMAARAQGLTWCVPKEDEYQLPKNAYIRAMQEHPDGDVLIVLSETPVGTPMTPTVEDGYLCCLKGIGGQP